MQILLDRNSCSKTPAVHLQGLQLTFYLLCIFAKIKIFQISDTAQMDSSIVSRSVCEDNEVLFLDFEIPSRRVLSFLYSWRWGGVRTQLEHSVSSACPDLTKQHSTPCQPIDSIYIMAGSVGFEPTRRFHA
jgi:hypothetical protein